MAFLQDNVQLDVTGDGTGATFRLEQYNNGVFEKTLIASIPTVAATPFNFKINDKTGDNSLNVGSNRQILLIESTVPAATPLATLISTYNDKFGVVGDSNNIIQDSNSNNFPGVNSDGFDALPNGEGSLILTAHDRTYRAGTSPATLFSQDAVASQVRLWNQVQPTTPVSAWTIDQPSPSLRSKLIYDDDINRKVLLGGRYTLTSPGLITTPDAWIISFGFRATNNSDGINMYLGSGINTNLVTVTRRGISAFNLSTVFYSNPVAINDYAVYTLSIPRVASVQGGRIELYVNGVLEATSAVLPLNRNDLFAGQLDGLLTISPNARLSAFVIQPELLNPSVMASLNASVGHTCGVTI